MSNLTLVAAHLSSLFASSAHVTTHPVPTSRRDIPLATTDNLSDFPDGHASYSSLFYSPQTGHVLLRVVQDGLGIELVSLSTDIPPVRYVFPAPVLPSPSLVLWQNRQLHLLAVTSVGSLYRIISPVHEGSQLWHGHLRNDWCREWQIKRPGANNIKLVHVQDFHSVVLALSTGGILRLDADFVEGEQYNEHWSESEYRLNNWYTSFLPVLPSSNPHPSEIISLASLPPPSDVADIFSISRDRVLRRWTVSKGCKSEISLTSSGSISTANDKPVTLFEPGPRKMIQVYTVGISEEQIVLVFVPTPTSMTAGGYFQSYAVQENQIHLLGSWPCSKSSVHWKMQDFYLGRQVLHVLWENKGQSMLEMTQFQVSNSELIWQTASYGKDTCLTQANIDELLMLPGSLADKFLQAILRPGIFSPLTLQGAIREYTEHYLSLAGPHPPTLLSSYATISENIAAIVGCTVELTRDPHTGIAQYKQYWNALRRDWEGFVARCRETERSARWPLAMGVDESSGRAIVIERERIGQCVEEDTPLRLYRLLSSSSPIEPVYALLDTCWMLRTKLSAQLVRRIESEMINILSQEFAFPLADIVIEASNRAFSTDDLDEGLESWVMARITVIGNMDSAIRTVLDVIGGLEKAVKQEEDEVELIIPPPTSEWHNALVSAYISESLEVRYNLCVALAILLFFIGGDLAGYDPALLGEVFAVFRGTGMLQYLCRQPAGDLGGARPSVQEPSPSEDVIVRFSNMNVSRAGKNPNPTYSLIHRLLVQSSHSSVLPAAAHYFLDQTGLLSTITPAYATKSEVLICERLRLLGYREPARIMMSWLPRTPAVSYLLGRLWIEIGRADESALVMQGVAGSFGPDSSLTLEDRHALASVLPAGQLFTSEFDFYLHVAELFRTAAYTSYDVFFSKIALSIVPEGVDATELWANVVKGYADLGLYEEAYSSLIVTPYDKLKQLCVGQLVYKMCEGNAVDRFMSMNFCGMVKEVEESLSFKARNADPRVRPFWSQILYTWYVERGDYRSAASTMYLRARKLAELEGDPAQLGFLWEQQNEALLVAMNALSITDAKSAWIIVPISHVRPREARKRRKLDNYIPEDKFVSGQRDVDIVTMVDIQYEHALLIAKLELLRRDPSLLLSGEVLPSARVTVSKLTQAGLFDSAMYTARALTVDMSELFQRLAIQCIQLSAAHDPSLFEIASDWLLTDKVSSWPGTPAERGWRYLRQSLERHDTPDTDLKYTKAVLETLLSHDTTLPPPPWLVQTLEEHHPDHLIRACLRYGLLEDALDHTLTLVRKANSLSNRTSLKQASYTWLSYTLIDAVLKTAEGDTTSSRAQSLRDTLRNELTNRIVRVQKQSERTH